MCKLFTKLHIHRKCLQEQVHEATSTISAFLASRIIGFSHESETQHDITLEYNKKKQPIFSGNTTPKERLQALN